MHQCGTVVEGPQSGITLFAEEPTVGAGEVVVVIDGQPSVLRATAGRLAADSAKAVLLCFESLSSLWGKAVKLVLQVLPARHVVLGSVVPSGRLLAGAFFARVASPAWGVPVGREVINRKYGLAGGADLLPLKDCDARAGREMSLKQKLDGFMAAVIAGHRHPWTLLWGVLDRLRLVLRVERAPFSMRPNFSGGVLFSAVRAGFVHASTRPDLCSLGLFHASSIRQPLLNVNELGGT